MKNFSEDLEMVLTMQDRELNEWNIVEKFYEEIEDEAFTRWQLFTFYLLDPDSEARLV